MKELEKWFRRGTGRYIYYQLEHKTDKTALFKLFIKEAWMKDYEHVGWEVCRILVHKEGELYGKTYPEREGIPSDEMFAEYPNLDKAFFPNEKQRAIDYFYGFDSFLHEPIEESNFTQN